MRARVAGWTFVVALSLFAAEPRASACLCFQPPPPDVALRRSAATFEGKILSLAPGGPYVYARVQVLRRWKAPDVAELVLATAMNGAGCGFGDVWKVGETWLFYAERDCDQLVAGICLPTKRIADAGADLAALGPPLPAGAEVADGGVTDGGFMVDASVTCGPDMDVVRDLATGRDVAVADDLAAPAPDLAAPAPDLAAPAADLAGEKAKGGACSIGRGRRGAGATAGLLVVLAVVGLRLRGRRERH